MAKTGHRPSALKTINKKHGVLGHKSKRQLRNAENGRVNDKLRKAVAQSAKLGIMLGNKNLSDAGSLCKSRNTKRNGLTRQERINQKNVKRSVKKEKVLLKKNLLGTESQPPFLVCVVVLSPDINPRRILSTLTGADGQAVITNSPQGATHMSCSRFKQRYSFVVPPIDDMYAILDTAKVCSTLMVVWPCRERDDEMLGEDQEKLLSAIKAQGLPTVTHVTLDYEQLPQKRKAASQKNLLQEVHHYFPGDDKARVFYLDKPGDPLLCLRQIGSQRQRSLFYRDTRTHLIAENISFIDDVDSATTGTLVVEGYIRGVPLDVNQMVHIPGWSDYSLSSVVIKGQDPHPLTIGSRPKPLNIADDFTVYPSEQKESEEEEEGNSEESDCSDSEDADSTDSINSEESNRTTSTVSVKSLTQIPVKKDVIPGAYSSYQAAWMIDNDAYKEGMSDSDENEDEFNAPDAREVDESECGDDDDRMSIVSGSEVSEVDENYDSKMDYDQELDEYERMKASEEDKEFTDEIDTPRDVLARERFHKYRGLESFHKTKWDINENLPDDYNLICQIPRFNHHRKMVFAHEKKKGGISTGQYVALHIANVEKHFYLDHRKTGSPLVVCNLLGYENKMSLINLVLKSHPIGHMRPIQSKDRLLFHVGFRRFTNEPIFSEHTVGRKQKFCRFFHPGMTVMASMYAPVAYPPSSVLVFRQTPSGRQDLVATGTVYSANTERCILKRIILSGHPFKIHKQSAVLRYMFYDRDDINWFKPIELRTKWGLRGKIKEPLGTHGHMKCKFSGTMKSQDTVFLTLYKRVFPKWRYDSSVTRAPPLYSKGTFDDKSDEPTEEEKVKIEERRDKEMMPPPPKKKKSVRFG